jgi:hypothetical protein
MRSSSSATQSAVAAEPPGPHDVASLARLRAEIRSRASDPYLLTVTPGGRPHCGTASVTWDAPDGGLTVRPVPRTWAESAGAGYRQATLLWPPAEPGGYDLIVDGACHEAGDDPALVVTVSRAVLHRRGPAPAGGASPCGSDCVPLTG